jgi:hypothetical protein
VRSREVFKKIGPITFMKLFHHIIYPTFSFQQQQWQTYLLPERGKKKILRPVDGAGRYI